MDAAKKEALCEALRTMLQTKKDAERREGFLRYATVENLKQESAQFVVDHGAELLAFLEKQPADTIN
jgi:hypothetical protein